MRLVKTIISTLVLIVAMGCADDPPEPETTGAAMAPEPSAVIPPASEMTIDQVERVSLEEFQDLINEGQVLIVDVRPAQSFIASHIPGSINMPLLNLSERMGELPRDRMIVAYCT